MDESRPRRDQGSHAGAVATRLHDDALDDWLGDVSDEDWDEAPAGSPAPRRASAPYDERAAGREPAPSDPDVAASTRHAAPPDDRSAAVARRRLVAVLLGAVALVVIVAIPVVLLRGGDDEPTATTPETTTTLPTQTQTTPSTSSTPETTTPETTTPGTTTPDTTTPSTTTPSTTNGASSFTLPEGTKLQRGAEADAALVTELQQALTTAGYDPGPADGTFGEQTEAAVVAFQQANGLEADGVVGPATAAALSNATAGG